MTQYTSDEFTKFMESLHIRHITSSPHYPQSNGQSERTVQTIKRLLKHSKSSFHGIANLQSYTITMVQLESGRADGKEAKNISSTNKQVTDP